MCVCVRERERERDRETVYASYIHAYIYIYSIYLSLQIFYHVALHFIKQPCQFCLMYSPTVSLAVKFLPLFHDLTALSDGVIFSWGGGGGRVRGVVVV